MQCTRFTDYALRVLIYVAQRPDEWVTIRQISEAYGVSRNHLMKVVSFLGNRGYLLSQRGPGGGVRLQVPAHQIRLADVLVDAEGGMILLPEPETLPAGLDTAHARLTQVLHDAVQAFLADLNGQSLADLLEPSTENLPRRAVAS
jgi:Rrf2 family nitric oxide-sensitive transcriptional repressor